ncbi:RSC8 ortholog with a swirm ZZ finger and Myb, putative [Babesia ovata]|uniref:RSC8 ortholog with a swirm ZZ finger and Myb, putative n=1 Tax=Babesia ovata TaxID=189622 RepID=A0A2H6KJ77_9APIC|nr:RSC8 ortholog with a swirm ZZ finger and Myb, putative [Babesia ovata]GBE63053.1 RSC8 ortholog with a swirm ZZ finger and Myb, putative [Babesia ovata]
MPLRRNCFVEFMGLEPKPDEREDVKCRISTPVQHWYDEKELNCIEREYVASIFHDADPSAIAKVYCILNYWGLINHGAWRHLTTSDEYLYQFNREIDTIKSHAASDADVSVPCKDVDGAGDATPSENKSDCVDAINAPFTLEKSLMDREIAKEQWPQRTCQSCRLPCKYMYYMVETPVDDSLEKYKDDVWCSTCYANSRYPLQVPRKSLVNVIVPVGAKWSKHPFVPSKWNRSRREKLYSAIDKFGLDWRLVQEEVGDEVTVRECIYHFVTAPLERETRGVMRVPVCFKDVVDAETDLPFFTSPNTVTAFLAFCASTISPIVASQAAKAILDDVLKPEAWPPGFATSEAEGNIIHGKHTKTGSKTETVCHTTVTPVRSDKKDADAANPDRLHAFTYNEREVKGKEAEASGTVIAQGKDAEHTVLQNPTVADATLFRAFERALQVSTDTCTRLAAMEQEKIDAILARIIDLKIKNLQEKMKYHAGSEEHMDNCRIQLVRCIRQQFTWCRGMNCRE